MSLITILLIFLIIFYCYLLFWWNKKDHWQLSPKNSNSIKFIHYGALAICLTGAMLNFQFDLDFRGIWTSRLFIFIVLITGLLIPFIADKKVIKKIATIYFKIFSLMPVITVATALFIPFLGIIIIVSSLGRLFKPYEKIYYQDHTVRIQSTFLGMLGPPRLDIYKYDFLLEKRLYRSNYNSFNIDSVKVNYDNDSTRVSIYSAESFTNKKRIISLGKIK